MNIHKRPKGNFVISPWGINKHYFNLMLQNSMNKNVARFRHLHEGLYGNPICSCCICLFSQLWKHSADIIHKISKICYHNLLLCLSCKKVTSHHAMIIHKRPKWNFAIPPRGINKHYFNWMLQNPMNKNIATFRPWYEEL